MSHPGRDSTLIYVWDGLSFMNSNAFPQFYLAMPSAINKVAERLPLDTIPPETILLNIDNLPFLTKFYLEALRASWHRRSRPSGAQSGMSGPLKVEPAIFHNFFIIFEWNEQSTFFLFYINLFLFFSLFFSGDFLVDFEWVKKRDRGGVVIIVGGVGGILFSRS